MGAGASGQIGLQRPDLDPKFGSRTHRIAKRTRFGPLGEFAIYSLLGCPGALLQLLLTPTATIIASAAIALLLLFCYYCSAFFIVLLVPTTTLLLLRYCSLLTRGAAADIITERR